MDRRQSSNAQKRERWSVGVVSYCLFLNSCSKKDGWFVDLCTSEWMRICAIYDGCCVALRRHRRRGKALKSKKLEGLIEIVIVFLKIDCEGHRVCRSVFRPSSILQRSCVRISVITDAYKTRVNFSLFLFLFLFLFFSFPLLQKLFPNFFFSSQRRHYGLLKKRECLLFSFLLPFFLFFFVYIGREYTCILYGYAYCISARVWRRADMPVLQLWVDRIVWERCPWCNMRWWSKTCAEMEDFCMKLRPFDRVMAVNRLFSSLLFRRVCFFFLLLLLLFFSFFLPLRLLPFYRKFCSRIA